MNVHEAIRGRRTVHEYEAGPVDPAALDRALEAAHHAPNHKLTWPWRYTVTGPETRRRITAIGVALKEAKGPLPPDLRAKVARKLDDPGALVVVSVRRTGDPARAREDYAATCCGIQNLLLSVHADGYGGKWSTGGVTCHPDTYAALGIDPAAEEIVGFVWIGRPARVPVIHRPPVDEVVRRLP